MFNNAFGFFLIAIDVDSYKANVKKLLELHRKMGCSESMTLLLKLTFEGRRKVIGPIGWRLQGHLRTHEETLPSVKPSKLCEYE